MLKNIVMYHLPQEILTNIYSYDDTYKDIFINVLLELGDKFFHILSLEKYDEQYSFWGKLN
jgi:hypothetical protein